MACLVHSGTILGVDASAVEVEVDLLRKLPSVAIVGLPDSAVRESADRVRSAIQQSGHEFPRKRIVVNLAPAGLRKNGAAFDLPIAIGIMAASGQIAPEWLHSTLFVGELSLGGALRPIRGALSLAIMCRNRGFERIVLPTANAPEAAAVDGLEVLPAGTLAEAAALAEGRGAAAAACPPPPSEKGYGVDLSEVRGQAQARRALEIAAAGGHNLLMVGPPGCGKTMLALRLPTILPKMDPSEALDVTRIHSAAGLQKDPGIASHRPFRAPHHSISLAGMVGNAQLVPGECSLAHNGVLFLDELPEFRRDVLESLRAPLENREITIAKAAGTVRFPAAFSLVAAANPCPCGFYGHPTRPCRCSPGQRERYRGRLSGPLRDRMDLQIRIPPVGPRELLEDRMAEGSGSVRERVETARSVQRTRYRKHGLSCNAQLGGDLIRRMASPDKEARSLVESIIIGQGLSGRAWSRMMKVARTISDLAGLEQIGQEQILEAIALRSLEDRP